MKPYKNQLRTKNSQSRQTEQSLLRSMLCNSVIKAFFFTKRDTEIDEDELYRNVNLKNLYKVRILTSTATFIINTDCLFFLGGH